jgi:hypothetical protein
VYFPSNISEPGQINCDLAYDDIAHIDDCSGRSAVFSPLVAMLLELRNAP